ncbi:peptidylprolyl isomerase [Rosistilla carotiformis]|uniref:peptidylprolyl isomerase n=1 Tax=Rosistilla carotiformis TaxID=2528017 RepID=UPI001E42A028|nr:peptidylprolyl isomerase [Rosistilla carotiformis]
MLIESLTQRQLLAVDLAPLELETSLHDNQLVGQPLHSETSAEGEAAPDLVAFAKALRDGGVVFFGAAWCPICTDQKELFEDGQNYLPFVEVTHPDHSLNATGTAEGISSFPTWRFQGGTEVEGVLSLAEISQRSGIAIPQGETPSFVPVDNQSVGMGSPLHLPIDAYDPDGQPLTVTVTSSAPSLLEASVISGNRSLRLKIANYGDMVFELYEQRAERPTARIIELAEAGFYDGVTFHRIVDDFVLQAGDPTGTGAGGSSLGAFDDQFHEDLQHNATGVLSYAKTFDDTNDSQFFITEGDSRHLDFNHSIFGQLVEGESVREAISELPTDSSDSLTTAFANAFGQITIETASIFTDDENSVIMLKPTGSGTGPVDVTITVTDSDGNQTSQVISVMVTEDNQSSANSKPFLDELSDVVTVAGQPATIPLSSTDVEADPVTYAVFNVGTVGYTTSMNPLTGEVTVTPPADFVGTFEVQVGVKAIGDPTTSPHSTAFDLQLIRVTVLPPSLQSLQLDVASDTGTSNTDNVTSASSPSFTVTGTELGATVDLMIGEDVLASSVAAGATVSFANVDLSGRADGELALQARQTFAQVVTTLETPLMITLDRSVPSQSNLSTNNGALATRPFVLDIDHDEEGNGLAYSLIAAPTGMSLDPTTGRIQWTPSTADVGPQSVDIRYTDLAGNTFDESLSIEVAGTPQAIFYLGISDIAGDPIDNLVVGDEFLLTVHVADNRVFSSRHVFSAYLDLIFDSSVAVPVGGDAIEFGPTFNYSTDGSISGNLVDELGAVADVFNIRNALLATIRMQAIAPGLFTAVGDAPEGIGHELLMVDTSVPVAVEEIDYGRVEIEISKLPEPMQLSFSSSLVADADFENVSNLTIQTETTGLVDIWADFNRNGSFNDPGEHIVSDAPVSNQTAIVPFAIPAGTTSGEIDFAYTISSDGDRTWADGDRFDGVSIVDAGSPIVVALDGQSIDLGATPENQLLAQQDGVTMFRAAAGASVTVKHGDGDSHIRLGNLSPILPEGANFTIQAGGGHDALTTTNFDQTIDLSGEEHLYSGIESITTEDASRITIDRNGFGRLAPDAARLDLSIRDHETLTLLGKWEILATQIGPEGLQRELVDGDATIGITGGPTWTNPSDPLDVNGSGSIEPLDALNILNELNRQMFIDPVTRVLPEIATMTSFPGRFYDTNRDGRVTPIDALRVINRLSILSLSGEHFSGQEDVASQSFPAEFSAPQIHRDEKDDDDLDAQLVDAFFS